MSSRNYFLAEQRTDVNHGNYYYFEQGFTPEQVVQIREICEKYPKQQGTTLADDSEHVSNYRISDISWIPENQETKWIYEKIASLSKIANKEMWNFDIWNFQDDLQYTTYYGDGGHYDWHMDVGPGISNRKLSVVVQLSDPSEYEGGDLQMNPGGSFLTVPKKLGLVCLFPSFLLHRVTPLNGGIRKSLVTWLCGANYR